MLDLSGIFIPITTPFQNGELALEKLIQNIDKWNATGVNGYVALGSTGECTSLSITEKLSVLETVMAQKKDGMTLIAGIGYEAIPETQLLIKKYAEIGVDAILISTPFYFRKKTISKGYIDYYLQVADNSSLPIILYNVPVYTDVKLSPEIIARVAQHPNIIGLKNSLSDYNHFISIFDRVDQDFQVLTGNASILLETFRLGARGGILAAATVSPDLCVQLYQEFIGQGRTSKLDKLQSRIKEINELVIIKYGVPGIKYVLDKNDYFGGDPRLPLLPLHEDDKFKLNFILR